jgi:hypothetical protein
LPRNLAISFPSGSQRIIFRCLLGLFFVFSSQISAQGNRNSNRENSTGPISICHLNADGTYTTYTWNNLNGSKQAEFDSHLDHAGDNLDGECVDSDGDGVIDSEDAFPLDADESLDTDSDGVGNNADTDDDGDGWSDTDEGNEGSDPLDATSVPTDTDGVGNVTDTDDDGRWGS